MTAATVTLVDAADLPPEDLTEVRRIYEEGFPAHLRAGFGTLAGGGAPGETALALMCGGRPGGFAVLRLLGPIGWAFLRYFVVDGRLRGQGLGGALWDAVTARLRAAGHPLLVFDVEDPAGPGCDAGEVAIRSRRIGFYQRHGAVRLPVHGYRTPHEAGGVQEWTPMLLLAAPLTPAAPALDERGARAVVAAVYRYRWRIDPGHPVVAAIRFGAVPDGTVPDGTVPDGTVPGETVPDETVPAERTDVAVDYELAESVAWIRLNRPHRLNAVVPELTAGLTAALDRARRDGARVAVLAGRGRAFCSGHDLKEPVPPETVLDTGAGWTGSRT